MFVVSLKSCMRDFGCGFDARISELALAPKVLLLVVARAF